jgi:hypothetical protein
LADFGEQIGNLPRDLCGAGLRDRGFCGSVQIARSRVAHASSRRSSSMMRKRADRGTGHRLSGAGEIGIDIDAIADVGHQQDRRPAMIDGQRLGIAFGLPLACTIALAQPGVPRRAVPRLTRAAGGLAEDVEIVLAAFGGRPVCIAALLGLQDEAIPLVAIDPAEAFVVPSPLS